jgi:2'-5' RNA ligase
LEQENYKKQDNLKIHNLNFDHYQYVIDNMRQWDLTEIKLQGYTKTELFEMFNKLQGVTATHNNIPVLCGGIQKFPNICWYWFFATPLVKEFFKNITREARKMIKSNIKKHSNDRHIVQVWSGHQESVKWLNILKFETFSSFYVGKEEILLMELKRI